jgi:mannose-6-phosphate isomerase
MHRIRRLRNPIREYAWGSHTALAELTGRPSPTERPEAELWIGAHPKAASEVRTEEGWVPLPDWIRRDPEAVLGGEVLRRFGPVLPFLFKALAAERSLSVQTHPDAERARMGFERENAAGLDRDDPRRSYPDPNPKPELICALAPFQALCGFRRASEIAEGLATLAVPALEAPLAALRKAPGREGLVGLLRGLFLRPEDDRGRLSSQLAEAAAGAEGDRPEHAWVVELARQHPGDLGVLAPLLLNLVDLHPGQALYLPAGEIHAHLRGVGVEIMGSSDNVLRAALTEKPVDVPELLEALSYRQGPPPVLRPRSTGTGVRVYDTPAREFELAVLRTRAGKGWQSRPREAVEILLCTEGETSVRSLEGGESTSLPRGSAALVPAAAGRYAIGGEATVFRAAVPI